MPEKADPIQDLEASILGGLLNPEDLEAGLVAEIKAKLTPGDFFGKNARTVYQAIMEMEEGAIGYELLRTHLNKTGKLEAAGGEDYLAGITERAIPSSAGIREAAKEIKVAAGSRRLGRLLQENLLANKEKPGQYREIADRVGEGIKRQTRAEDLAGGAVPSMREVLIDVEEALFCRKYKPIPTFSGALNNNLNGGIQRGRVFTITGPAGGGKSTLALQILDGIAQGNRLKAAGDPRNVCLYVHLEQGRAELLAKSYSRLAEVNGGDFERQTIKVDDPRIKEARRIYAEEIAPYLYIIQGEEGLTLRDVRALVRKVMAQQGGEPCQVVLCVDPFQRLQTGDPATDGKDETMRIGHLAAGLKILARDLEAAVILLSDTTKSGADKMAKGEEPTGTEISWAYMAQHTTDVSAVILTYKLDPAPERFCSTHGEFFQQWKSYTLSDNARKEVAVWAELFFSKQRSGSVWPVPFIYKKAFNKFCTGERMEAPGEILPV